MSERTASTLRSGVRRASVATLAVAMATALPAGEPARAQDGPCPAPFPADELQVGQELHGLTVDRGTTPEPFEATVIGVIDDGIALGLDMIIVEATSDAITAAGGIWAGMSGSPMYAEDGRLVGAVAYGLAGSSPIAGITPAGAMYALLRGGGPAAAPPKVELTAALEAEIVASGAATVQEAGGGLRRLPVPLAVSGTTPGHFRRVSRMIRRHVGGVRVYASGRASGAPAAVGLEPGGNVAATVAYGDTTIGGVGTVTAVCGSEALLFGHPFLFNGATTASAHAATAVFVQPDPLNAPFKVANIGGAVGTVDQDRLAGLRTTVGTLPTTTRVRSTLSSAESGVSRRSSTRVVLPEFIPFAAAVHVLNNLDRVHDRLGPGVVTMRWGASGTRANGRPWQFRRREKLASSFDVTIFPADRILIELDRLINNPFERITIDNISASGTVDPRYVEARLVRVEQLGANGRWRAVSPRSPLRLVAGSQAFLRGVFRPARSTRLRRVQFSFRVPRWAGSSGALFVSAGVPEFEEPGGSQPRSFNQLLSQIDQAPTGDTLRAELRLSRRVPGVGRQRIRRETRTTAPIVITGGFAVAVEVVAPAAG